MVVRQLHICALHAERAASSTFAMHLDWSGIAVSQPA